MPAAGAGRRPRPGCPRLSDWAACSAWSRHTITVKNDGSCSRRPETATQNIARAIPAFGGVDLGVVGDVAGEAHAGLGHDAFLLNAWPGRCWPALGTGGWWMLWHADRPPWAAVEPTKSAMDQVAERARLGCRDGWWALRLGSGMAAPSGQIPPPWARWENEAPATRAARGPLRASAGQAAGLVAEANEGVRLAETPNGHCAGGGSHVRQLGRRPSAPLDMVDCLAATRSW
jgi:hypothetical protein